MKESISPPSPPEMTFRFRFYPFQLVMIPLLILIPLLALMGVFGDRVENREVQGEGVSISAHFPSMTRFDQRETLRITIHSGAASIPAATLRISRTYLDYFAGLSFMPTNVSIDSASYVIDLGDIPANTTHVMTLEYRAARMGMFIGSVMLETENAPLLDFELSTFVFP